MIVELFHNKNNIYDLLLCLYHISDLIYIEFVLLHSLRYLPFICSVQRKLLFDLILIIIT